MAFQARHRWLIGRIKDCLGLPNERIVENAMKTDDTMRQLDVFFSENGPCVIFFFYQVIEHTDALDFPPEARNDASDFPRSDPVKHGNSVTMNKGIPELFLTDGLSVPFRGRGVYFLRNYTGRNLDQSIGGDDEISFGALTSNMLSSLECQLTATYKSMINAKPPTSWDHASSENVREFMRHVEKFEESITKGFKTLSNGLELKKPSSYILEAISPYGIGIPLNQEKISELVELLLSWCSAIESYLEEDNNKRPNEIEMHYHSFNNMKTAQNSDEGPRTELDYWRRRMQRLTNITESLKSQECRGVISVLTSVSKLGNTNSDEIYSSLRRWRQIDIKITEAANEAKDNVKYLSSLEKFILPLYNGTPIQIMDTLPALMNSIKMIHTISRYYNTTQRMQGLFTKISNQMILNCKKYIVRENGDDIETIWDIDPDELLRSFTICLRLNESYQEQYHITKDKLLAIPKSRQFDFSEPQIFGRIDLFCQRILKLMEVFSTVQQFQALGRHDLEGVDDISNAFFEIVKRFKSKRFHLLDCLDNQFDREYVEFNIRIIDLEASVLRFINRSFESITSIESSLELLNKFKTVLKRNNLKTDLDSKFNVIFHNYGLDLTTVQELYEKHKHNPPVCRNMTPVAGNILWSRNLLKRIEDPMRKFETNAEVLKSHDAKKIIKTYNKVAKTLVAFEYLWYEAWCASIQSAKAGLQATLIIRHPETRKLYVNFDREILQLIREAKLLSAMSVELPNDVQLILFQEEKFKMHLNELQFLLSDYERIVTSIAPIAKDLLSPHIEDMDSKLKPGMISLTWTSLNIEAYEQNLQAGLAQLEELVININDIIENRIEKNLKQVGKVILIDLPSEGIITLDEFVRMQELFMHTQTNIIRAKNIEIETAVQDLINVVLKYPSTNGSSKGVSVEEFTKIVEHYNRMMYQALLQAVKKSLAALKSRVCAKGVSGFIVLEKPFFEVDVQLSVPTVRLVPSLEEVQLAINETAKLILWSTKTIWDWGQQHIPDDDNEQTAEITTIENERAKKESFFNRIGKDKEIVRSVLLLTGALLSIRNKVKEYLSKFSKYDWLWKDDMESTYNHFISKNPTIEDFEAELIRFGDLETEIKQVVGFHNIGALCLNSSNLKLQLHSEASQWKIKYSDKVHQQARAATEEILEYIACTQQRVGREVDSLESLRYVMNVLKEIRERESTIEMEISPIIDMYDMLDHYLPAGVISKDEMDKKCIVRNTWRKLVDYAEVITDQLHEVQGKFKSQLKEDIKTFIRDVKAYNENWNTNGPTAPGLRPKEAVERLQRFKSEFETMERKREICASGEELFSLKQSEFPELTKIKKELNLLTMLYDLYMNVVETMDTYRVKSWSDCLLNVHDMSAKVSEFAIQCKRLPSRMHHWDAYRLLKKDIDDFQAILPLLLELSKSSIKPRHWLEFNKATGINFNPELGRLKDLWTSDILRTVQDIEEICQGADKQLEIEANLTSIKEKWATEEFALSTWRDRECYVLIGFNQVIEDLEDSQLGCQTMLSMRYVEPFRAEVSNVLSSLSDSAEILELWSKVQMLWVSLESIFTGGDIAKQMPSDAKTFARVDKDFCRIMDMANETKNVIRCCSNEVLKNTLPILLSGLERCQKSLEGYLCQKRSKFPRFYFVSNPVLLQILSQGSDPESVQPYYEKIFDSINQVEHQDSNPKVVTHMKQVCGTDEEVVAFNNPVEAQGNIEDWLFLLEIEMKKTVKNLCEHAAASYPTTSDPNNLQQFIFSVPAQFALLGLQISWTAEVTEAISRCNESKNAMSTMNKKQFSILSCLSSWCLENLKTKLNRRKIETLVTIQVHQRDVFTELYQSYKDRRTADINDFEWLKQIRFYWQANREDNISSQGTCLVSVCDAGFNYSYEYLGCQERLVITPLTNRCYITLTQALDMKFGGAPAGPAGTGKTETVKDLGRSLGIYVVVTNCTDQQRYTDMAKIFKGLCQAGLWGCFDEFNRIELPVLSVVAQQVLAITNAKRMMSSSFLFPGDSKPIQLQKNVGYFITMNPGYAGRQELPENLKVLFRSVAMMVPNREMIMRVKLCSCGYTNFTELAKKFNTLHLCCEEQLSKQKHYDFGLRNILSVLRTAGQTKRDDLEADEALLIMKTLRNTNLSKLVAKDVPLFLSLLNDLFPNLTHDMSSEQDQVTGTQVFNRSMSVALKTLGLQNHASWTRKVIQVHDTVKVRHGIMLVGPSGGGKTAITETLAETLSICSGVPHKQVKMNPKAIKAEEMFGETDPNSTEWLNGVFSSIWSKYNDRHRKDITWIVCDGPVDAIWIENLNTVLDDNRILTLANGDRIPMTDNVKLFFEVENLNNASPATVSRTGIVYVSESDLDWFPVLESWLTTRPEAQIPILRDLFYRYLVKGTIKKTKEKRPDTSDSSQEKPRSPGSPSSSRGSTRGSTRPRSRKLTKSSVSMESKDSGLWLEDAPMEDEYSTSEIGFFDFCDRVLSPVLSPCRVNLVSSCFTMLETMLNRATLSHSPSELDGELEKVFLFSFIWTFGGLLETADRAKLEIWLTVRSNALPKFTKKENIYDFWLDIKTMQWNQWGAKDWLLEKEILSSGKGTTQDSQEVLYTAFTKGFASIFVPSSESERVLYLLRQVSSKKPVLVVGGAGTAKTATCQMFIDGFNRSEHRAKKFNFSHATTPRSLQSMLEGELDKRGGKTFGPPGGLNMTVFLDDLSIPQQNEWGDQPTLELLRQVIETGNMAYLDKDKRGDLKSLEGLNFLAAMKHSVRTSQSHRVKAMGTGYDGIPNRLKRHFFAFNMILPTVKTINDIYGHMLRLYFHRDKKLCDISANLVKATVNVWNKTKNEFLPSPSKVHYSFSMREISRVFQGVFRVPMAIIKPPPKNEDKGRSSIVSKFLTSEMILLQAWRHEIDRVFADKLTSVEEKEKFSKTVYDIVVKEFGAVSAANIHYPNPNAPSETIGQKKSSLRKTSIPQKALTQEIQNPDGDKSEINVLLSAVSPTKVREAVYFCEFMRNDEYDNDGCLVREAAKIYEPVSNLEALMKKVQSCLHSYNETNTSNSLNIVLFRGALCHLLRISRIISMSRGSALLVGVGGSGRQSLTKLAAYISKHKLFQLPTAKNYNHQSLLEDFRTLFKLSGSEQKQVTLLLTEAEIRSETFLEVLNSFLLSGHVPGLFQKDELVAMAVELRDLAKRERTNFVETTENLIDFLIDTIRNNFHIVLCVSPMNRHFPEWVRKFPGIVSATNIDWFLPWSHQALVAVARRSLELESNRLDLACDKNVKTELIQHMGTVHQIASNKCEEYFYKMRRHVYQTPKSFFLFLKTFKILYAEKLNDIADKENRIALGLQKLVKGAEDVEDMKIKLAKEEVKLQHAEKACNDMLLSLEISSLEAAKEAERVHDIKSGCESETEKIMVEKLAAADDLAAAQPYLDEANAAVNSIKPNDLNELKKLPKPGDIIKLTFDCVMILQKFKLEKVKPNNITLGIGTEKSTEDFIQDSYSLCQKNMLSSSGFLKSLFEFSKAEKDDINDETIELLMPYIELNNFNPVVARNASQACEGLNSWVIAMVKYHAASKVVKPKLEALEVAQAKLDAAMEKLQTAEKTLKKCKETLGILQSSFQKQMEEKAKVEQGAIMIKQKMDQATALIEGLKDERIRWTDDAKAFADTKNKLVGDCVMAAAFISYCGPFNQSFREEIVYSNFYTDLLNRKVPVTSDPRLDLIDFLVDVRTAGEWNLQGLPIDSLSMQNGILVTRTMLFPLLVDPQGQGLQWIKQKEKKKLAEFGIISINEVKLKDRLEYCMSEGKVMIIIGINDNGLDPILTPVLEKQIVQKGKSKYISLGEKACEYSDEFALYMVTNLANPNFAPEVQAMVTTIDFTVTQPGLEDQLLGQVIRIEQKALEEQLTEVLESVTVNKRMLIELNDKLLRRLTENTGNLLDDVELIRVLANTKKAAVEVNEKLKMAEGTKLSIDEKREHYRPVARRASILYFSIVDLSLVNPMYQTSLSQFLSLFHRSVENAEKSSISIFRRISSIIDYMTFSVQCYISRGLYERDKIVFLVVLLMKMLMVAKKIDPESMNLLLRAGTGIDIHEAKTNPFSWMPNTAYLNILQLEKSVKIFASLIEKIRRSEVSWRNWYESSDPEATTTPDFEQIFIGEVGAFNKLLLVRCLREDRTVLAVVEFIKRIEFIEENGYSVPGLGPKYTLHRTETVASITKDMDAFTPAIYLLSSGADPTESIEHYCKKQKKQFYCVALGEGQEGIAQQAILEASSEGGCVLLQNAHLGLSFIHRLCEILDGLKSNRSLTRADTFSNENRSENGNENKINPDFRLYITTEPNPNFSIALLQRSIKVTNEPPKGLKAGLLHSYSMILDQDKLERVETDQWRKLTFVLCFLHSIVQERRKFGALGWVVPYEFNASDLQASLHFLEKHLIAGNISWTTVQYMVTEVQYGGRITDDYDRRIFNTFTEKLISSSAMLPGFSFSHEKEASHTSNGFVYNVLDHGDVDSYLEIISTYPEADSPELFGLHANADITFRVNEVNYLLKACLETQPKEPVHIDRDNSQDIVHEKANELIEMLPIDLVAEEYEEKINSMGGLGVPLNVFLLQELHLIQKVISRTRNNLESLKQAIKGEIMMTSDLSNLLDSLAVADVPKSWIFSPSGDEISWQCSVIGLWFSGLDNRAKQLRSWLEDGRPTCYWLTGFFNPQGFLTAVKQEVTRLHKLDGWALDSSTYHTEVTAFEERSKVRSGPKEGCYVYGLVLEAARWGKDESALVESLPRVLFSPLPVLYVTAAAKHQKRRKKSENPGRYQCPVYRYPNRRNFVFEVSLPTGVYSSCHWVLRGTTLLLSTDTY